MEPTPTKPRIIIAQVGWLWDSVKEAADFASGKLSGVIAVFANGAARQG